MTRPLISSEYIFGIHEPGGEHYMSNAGRPGWILFTESIGSDPNDHSGKDYSYYSEQGFGIICRLNNGYYPQGTIPHSSRYTDFAKRCANFVAASRGCMIWIIGNEMNYEIERPHSPFGATDARAPQPEGRGSGDEGDDAQPSGAGNLPRRIFSPFLRSISGGMGDAELVGGQPPVGRTDAGSAAGADETGVDEDVDARDPRQRANPARFSALNEVQSDDEPSWPAPQGDTREDAASQVITPRLYTDCYSVCRHAIHAVPGHEEDQVLVGPVAPWNNQTAYIGNPNGDWVQYLHDTLLILGPAGCDGIALHTYTHQADTNLIYSDAKMNPPFQDRHYEFRAYQDFMNGIPGDMRHLPVYITETDQDVPWLDSNIGWVQAAYGEIDYWNRQPGNQQIHSLILYRWPQIDRWYIEGKRGVIDDFRQALQYDYRWRPQLPPADFEAGDVLETTDLVNLRRTPGYQNKPDDDVLATLAVGQRVAVLDDRWQSMDGLIWWLVETVDSAGAGVVVGWLAQTSPTGVPLVRKVDEPEDGEIRVGARVRTLDHVIMRRTPGYVGKSDEDVVAVLPPATEGTVVSGPESADGLTWWQVRSQGEGGEALVGWMAEFDPNGNRLLERVGEVTPPANGGQIGTFKPGDRVTTLDYVRVRRSPGYVDKDESDVVQDVAPGTEGVVRTGPRYKDELTWWDLRLDVEGSTVDGWAAEVAPNGVVLLGPADDTGDPVEPGGAYGKGELVQAATYARVRRTPGYSNKPADDVLGAFAPEATLNIIAGPRQADELTWWRVGGITPTGEVIGWVAETAPNGVLLIQRPPKLPGTDIPNPATNAYLGAPYRGRMGISQLWGENPDVYRQFTYDGVPLQGHNGIDFLTVTGTEIFAVDNGIVAEVVYNDLSGLGHYVKLNHGWGESIYAHMQDISVAPGQSVRRGDLLGHSDNTGYSGGPHLHFSIRINPYERTDGWGGFSDPLPYMNPADYQLPHYVLPGPTRLSAAAAPAPATSAHGAGVGMAPDHPAVSRP